MHRTASSIGGHLRLGDVVLHMPSQPYNLLAYALLLLLIVGGQQERVASKGCDPTPTQAAAPVSLSTSALPCATSKAIGQQQPLYCDMTRSRVHESMSANMHACAWAVKLNHTTHSCLRPDVTSDSCHDGFELSHLVRSGQESWVQPCPACPSDPSCPALPALELQLLQ